MYYILYNVDQYLVILKGHTVIFKQLYECIIDKVKQKSLTLSTKSNFSFVEADGCPAVIHLRMLTFEIILRHISPMMV